MNIFVKEVVEKKGYESITPKRIREAAQTGKPCKGYSAERTSTETPRIIRPSPLTPDEKILKLTEEVKE
ncbi:MAG: hypothetical protein ABSA33_04675 [Candidatus Micrarchaeaceae archaeon]